MTLTQHTQRTGKTVYEGQTDQGDLFSQSNYTYNRQGRLWIAELDTNGDSQIDSTIEYGYDDKGIRYSQDVDGQTTLYLYDHQNPTGYAQILHEGIDADGDGVLVGSEIERSYVLGHDVISQMIHGGTVAGTYFLLYDGHGSTRGLFDSTALIAAGQVFAYDAYGNAIGFNEATRLTALLHSGEFLDLIIGKQYLRARYYDLATGTFIRLDPFAGLLRTPQSFHKYAFVHGDPVQLHDPTGLLATGITGVSTSIASQLSFSIGASVLLTSKVATSVGSLVETSVLRSTAARLDVEYERDYDSARRKRDPSKRHFVHGTTTAVWQGFASAIQVFTDGRPLDFGYGFYTRLFTPQGYSDASRFAISRSNYRPIRPLPGINDVSNRIGGVPFVIVYAMSWTDWMSLSYKSYGLPTAPTQDFERDVSAFRSGATPFANKDVVYGPTAQKVGGVWGANPQLSNQYKFEARGITKLKPVFLLPARDLFRTKLA